jgi:hypothetical protein
VEWDIGTLLSIVIVSTLAVLTTIAVIFATLAVASRVFVPPATDAPYLPRALENG